MSNIYNDPAYTSRHESGHATLMTLLDVGIESMGLLPGDKDYNGEIVPTISGKEKLRLPVDSMKVAVDKGTVTFPAEVLVAIAGPIAGAMFAKEWPADGSPAGEYWSIFGHDKDDRAVLNAALLQTNLANNLCDHLIQGLCLQVHEILRRNWQALEALAEDLITHERLDGDAINAILRNRFNVC